MIAAAVVAPLRLCRLTVVFYVWLCVCLCYQVVQAKFLDGQIMRRKAREQAVKEDRDKYAEVRGSSP
jgi:hypothetical protein